MTRSERLKPVAALKQREQLNCARLLSQSLQQVQTHEQRLQELIHYRNDYQARFNEMAVTGTSIERIRHYQHFIAKLDQSIAFQSQRLENSKRQLEDSKKNWQKARARSQAFENVVQRYRAEEVQSREQRRQKESDDLAQRSRRAHDAENR